MMILITYFRVSWIKMPHERRKWIRGNAKSLVNKKLRSVIKKRSRLKTRLIKLNLPMT